MGFTEYQLRVVAAVCMGAGPILRGRKLLPTLFSQISCWSLNMTRALVPTVVLDQLGKASLAAWTASLNSASVVRGMREITSCVACMVANPSHFLSSYLTLHLFFHDHLFSPHFCEPLKVGMSSQEFVRGISSFGAAWASLAPVNVEKQCKCGRDEKVLVLQSCRVREEAAEEGCAYRVGHVYVLGRS